MDAQTSQYPAISPLCTATHQMPQYPCTTATTSTHQGPPVGYPNSSVQTSQQLSGAAGAEQHAADAAAASDEGSTSRGLGSTLQQAANVAKKWERTMHHVAHPGQAVKFHTVDKVKRKVQQKTSQAVGKVLNKVLP